MFRVPTVLQLGFCKKYNQPFILRNFYSAAVTLSSQLVVNINGEAYRRELAVAVAVTISG